MFQDADALRPNGNGDSSRTSQELRFRGEVVRAEDGSSIIVRLSVGDALELGGAHAELAATALDVASVPVSLATLTSVVAERSGAGAQITRDMIASLVQHGILHHVVPAAERIFVEGDDGSARALRAYVGQTKSSAGLPRITIAALGTLGSPRWRERLEAAQRLERLHGPVLSWNLEGSGCWIGPGIGVAGEPCPACLAARRKGADETACADDALAHAPQSLELMCAHAVRYAEQWCGSSVSHEQVLHVSDGSAARRMLLAQPGCHYCQPPARSRDAREACATTFRDGWTRLDRPEPAAAEREPFLDPLLGPLEIREYRAPSLFRDLPLVLGSIRLLQPRPFGFERRELFSVTFGTGLDAARRHLVAYAEGIERYALTVDVADVTATSLSELGEVAVPPDATARFLPEQYSGRPGAPARYEDQRVDWSWVHEWTSGDTRLVIHDAVGFQWDATAGAFRFLEDPFSSGAAAHRSLALAARRALLELIERDALLLCWYLRLPLRELEVGGQPADALREMHEYLTTRGIELRYFDARVDFAVPTVFVVACASQDCGQWRRGGRIFSVSASPTWRGAAQHALTEIIGHYSVFALVAPDGDSSVDPITGQTRSWWPGFATHFVPSEVDPTVFLGSRQAHPLPDDDEEPPLEVWLADLRDQFRQRNMPVLLKPMAPDVVARSGLVAIRACVPGLLRLAPSRESVNLGEPRIEKVRAAWGAPEGWNPASHPIA